MPHTLFLALGSNLGDRAQLLALARELIGERVGEVVGISSELETEPEGFISEHSFLNQVIKVETDLTPYEVLSATQKVEVELGRTAKSEKGVYQDRTCDIDIIFYDDLILKEKELEIPHPRFRERLFVLQPLADLCPKQVDPMTGKTVEELLWVVS